MANENHISNENRIPMEADPRKIGAYLKKLIAARYRSQADFCEAYLLEDHGVSEQGIDPEEKRRLENRLSQILKGSKSVQTYDLLIFAKLLDVSCEAILTAGKRHVRRDDRLTNYTVALSKKHAVWEEYIRQDDEPLLRCDEFGYSVLDYAVKFRNAAFIRFLLDEGYLTVTIAPFSRNRFCVRTHIKTSAHSAWLQRDFRDSEEALRTELIKLALEEGDITLLEQLSAREFPSMREWNSTTVHPEFLDAELIRHIAQSERKIIDYFTAELVIPGKATEEKLFLYPFIGALAAELLRIKSDAAPVVLQRIADHNEAVYAAVREAALSELLFQAKAAVTKYNEKENAQKLWWDERDWKDLLNRLASETLGFHGRYIGSEQGVADTFATEISAHFPGVGRLIRANIFRIPAELAAEESAPQIEAANTAYENCLALQHEVDAAAEMMLAAILAGKELGDIDAYF